MILGFFCNRSGQKINPSKSGIFFSRNVEHNAREELCSILDFPQTENLGKYLGVPLSPKKLKKQDCNFILEKVRAKLDGWKTKFFSMAGRRILASSVLASIPNFYMQSFMLPASTLSQLDKITRDFLWGSDLLKRKIHMVAWDTVTLPKSLGGLGLKSAKEANLVAMAKLNWRLFSERDKLWCQIIASKYGIGTQPSSLPRNGSPMLNNIRKGSELFQKGIKWVPYNGRSISFWNDCWVMDAPLSNLLSGPISSQDRQLTVADAFVNGRFQPNKISYPIQEDLVRIISATPTAITSSSTDSFCWKGSSDGSFSSTSAYNLAKGLHHSPKGDWKWIWKIQTLPKIQQFIWLLSHERLKTLGFLHELGIVESPTCPLCLSAMESCSHLFRNCPSVRDLWEYFFPGDNSFEEDSPLFLWLQRNCSKTTPSPSITVQWGTLFSFVIWIIWLQRNEKIYRPQSYDPNRAKILIKERAMEFISTSPYPTTVNSSLVSNNIKWDKPPEGYF
ncbi:hypothetical protein SLE2022_281540 [Rubroshorea leprosula]